jgi:putative two-component system response regulator
MLCRLLTGEGFACTHSATVAQARERLQDENPEAVLLDVHLAGESGVSFARVLARLPESPAVIMISGQEDAEVAAIALENGAYGYLTKPFKRTEVAIALDDALRRRARERALRASHGELQDRVVERAAVAQDALERLRHAHEETVLRLSKAIEYRDPQSAPHIDRMSRYSGLLARHFDLEEGAMRVASRLHDVGTIAVPDAILQKAGPLSPEQRAIMQRHAETGHRLLRGSDIELLDLAATIAWTHHERFDGTGYPRGLTGAAIPLPGRIVAVADVFDTLITPRAYRPARSVEEAVATLSGERGHHFDPSVVDAFLSELDAIETIIAQVDEPAIAETFGPAAAAPALATLQEAASAVGVSPSTLRRWADEGRIPAVRTAGGHRRFTLDAVRRLCDERGRKQAVRPVQPPARTMEHLASVLSLRGADLATAASNALYRGGQAGWFAAGDAAPAIAEFLAELGHATRTSRYDGALEATDALMRRASLQGTPLLERHRFLERLGDVALRALSQGDAPQDELAASRRLFAALQQAQLDGRS